MSFADPQTVTISGTPITLARTGSGLYTGTFGSNDGLAQLGISSQYGKRTRRVLRYDTSKIAADPLISSTNVKYSMSTYIVADTPVTGYTVAEAKAVMDGFLVYLAASSGAALTKLLGGEN